MHTSRRGPRARSSSSHSCVIYSGAEPTGNRPSQNLSARLSPASLSRSAARQTMLHVKHRRQFPNRSRSRPQLRSLISGVASRTAMRELRHVLSDPRLLPRSSQPRSGAARSRLSPVNGTHRGRIRPPVAVIRCLVHRGSDDRADGDTGSNQPERDVLPARLSKALAWIDHVHRQRINR